VKRRSGTTRQGNRWWRQVLGEMVHVAATTKLGEPTRYGRRIKGSNFVPELPPLLAVGSAVMRRGDGTRSG